ncbi:hypothetical protein NEAUS07_1260 [Nematocida ausubeli]|nr:hypothetical protein NEAUS07_1260 [Nematocida ausubeli]
MKKSPFHIISVIDSCSCICAFDNYLVSSPNPDEYLCRRKKLILYTQLIFLQFMKIKTYLWLVALHFIKDFFTPIENDYIIKKH